MRGFLLRRRREQFKRRARLRVLMVCRVNFCRSPMAEGVFGWKLAVAGLAEQVFVDSAGVNAQMAGQSPDPRGQKITADRGIDISAIRSRQIVSDDLQSFDYILTMDQGVHDSVLEMCETEQQRSKVQLLYRYARLSAVDQAQAVRAVTQDDSIPDPYYGGSAGFDRVINMLEQATDGLLEHLRQQLLVDKP